MIGAGAALDIGLYRRGRLPLQERGITDEEIADFVTLLASPKSVAVDGDSIAAWGRAGPHLERFTIEDSGNYQRAAIPELSLRPDRGLALRLLGSSLPDSQGQ
jgi:hypothetical protein